MLLALLLQTAAPAPDIHFNARVQARSVTISKQGEASLTVRASPDAGSLVEVRAPDADGRRRLRNVEIEVDAQARIGDPRRPISATVGTTETSSPQ